MNSERFSKRGNVPCIVEGCPNFYYSKGYCSKHYARLQKGIPLDAPDDPRVQAMLEARARKRLSEQINNGICTVPDCTDKISAKGLCARHYQRSRNGLPLIPDPTAHYARKPIGHRQLMSNGYVKIKLPKGGMIYEHRLIMEQHIGRPLLSTEEVHHINGDRADNRIDNLELWVKTQPSGQRASDLLSWAESIIATYGPIQSKLL